MPTETKSWTEKQRLRIKAAKTSDYIFAVADGTETNPSKTRLETCLKLYNKVMPDLKAVDMKIDGGITVQVVRFSDLPAPDADNPNTK